MFSFINKYLHHKVCIMWFYHVFIMLVLVYFNNVLSQTCPLSEDISPCLCHETRSTLHVHCSKIPSLEKLLNAVRGMYGNTFTTFTIEGSNLGHIPYDIFENVRIKHLSISKSNFTRIGNLGDPQFLGLENSLETLMLKETYSESDPLSYISLGHLKKLHTFDFWKGYAGLVSNHWFKEGPVSLKTFRCVEAHVRNVGYKALQALINLQIVDLSDNDMKYVTRTMFPNPALHLEEINLERNKLESLEENIFSGMPRLKRVNLELNEFSTIDETVWRPVWSHLQFLNIDYNPMICDKKIKWMYDYNKRLDQMLVATCYKPLSLMDRHLYDLKIEELK